MPLKSENLPVYTQRKRILEALEAQQVIIVESPTGSGKTTQLPIILHEAGYAENGIIGITQPRRIAAVGVSRYIAGELQSEIGAYVGYKMRFEDFTSRETRLKILTDGTLLQEMKGDRLLSSYSVLMIDEAHERTLNIDFILGLIKDILPKRADLKVIISSATLNPKAFSHYFDDVPILTIDTPIYPVKIHYKPLAIEKNEEVLIETIVEIVEKNVSEADGDILVFCTGEKMIKDTVNKLQRCRIMKQLHILPLYARIGSEEQEKVFNKAPKGLTKIVVATNIAETSLTIDGISTVIDTGMAKLNYYNPATFTNALIETEISRASAEQRKGRAGRTRPGVCYRLYSKEGYKSRPEYTLEEIYRTDLAEVILRMAEIGIRDFETFSFIDPPSAKGIQGAVKTLRLLDAIDKENRLTDIGKEMATYPLMPRHARMIVEAVHRYPGVLRETIIASTFLSTNSPYLLPQGEEMEARRAHNSFRSDNYGDFATYLNLYWEYLASKNRKNFAEKYYLDKRIMDEILAISTQLEEITAQSGIPISEGGSSEDFLKACARGLIPFICIRMGRFDYRSVGMDRIIIHPGSVLFREKPDYIVAGEIVKTSQTYARSVSPIDKSWLAEIYPQLPNMLLESNMTAKRKRRRDRSQYADNDYAKKDSTNQIWIAGTAFPLQRSEGKRNKRYAVLDWAQLHRSIKSIDYSSLPDFGSLKGSLTHKGEEVLVNSKVNIIIKAAKALDPSKSIRSQAPQGNFHIHKKGQLNKLIVALPEILSVIRESRKSSGGTMGFITLYNDGKGHFWFKSNKNFHAALNVSLESLDSLDESISAELNDKSKRILGLVYRRLEALLY